MTQLSFLCANRHYQASVLLDDYGALDEIVEVVEIQPSGAEYAVEDTASIEEAVEASLAEMSVGNSL